MRHLPFYLIMLISTLSNAQKLELINIDNVSNLPLGQGIELELRLKIDEFQIDESRYELISEPKLTNKFILIPKDTGRHKIGPIKCGTLFSNQIIFNVVPPIKDTKIFIEMPDSSKVGELVKLTITNTSVSEDYRIKDLKLIHSSNYYIVEQSFSMSISTKGSEQLKKETVTVVIKVLKEGKIVFDENSFTFNKGERLSIEGKTLNVSP